MQLKVFRKFDHLIWVDYIDEVTQKSVHHLQLIFISIAFRICYLIGWNHDAICKLQSSYKVHLNTLWGLIRSSTCINRGLTLVRLINEAIQHALPITLVQSHRGSDLLSTDVLRAFSALSHHWEMSSVGALPWNNLWTASCKQHTANVSTINNKPIKPKTQMIL